MLAEATHPSDAGGAVHAVADKLRERPGAERELDEYPADWAKHQALCVTLLEMEHNRDRRHETLSLCAREALRRFRRHMQQKT